MDVRKIVEGYQDEMIANLRTLVSYESVLGPSTKECPFGEVPAACLNKALEIASGFGFKTKNLDNYAGYAEIGEGEKLIGVIGHLDVVPLGEGWTHDPLGGEIVDGKMYGRGTTDDKGPVIAAMYALRIIKDMYGDNLHKRVRVIMGTNEETGSRCLKHYVEKEGHIDYGFTPDGNFPGVFGEKGGVHLSVTAPSKLIDVEAGLAANIVPNKVTCTVKCEDVDIEAFKAYLDSVSISYEVETVEGTYKIVVYGVAAHASLPDLGKNAVSYLMMALHAGKMDDEFVNYYVDKIGLTTDGSAMGINCHDEFGALTFNVGIIRKLEDTVSARVDIRYPVRMRSVDVCDLITSKTSDVRYVTIESRGEPLFYEPTSPLVTLLKESYQEVTGLKDEPITMGGGTYAKGINNCIAFGSEWPNEDVHIHDADEYILLEHFIQQTVIYVKAIQKLIEFEG